MERALCRVGGRGFGGGGVGFGLGVGLGLAVLGMVGAVLPGCGGGSGGGVVDLDRMTDRSVRVGLRESMIRGTGDAVARGELGSREAYEALKRVAWQRASSAARVRVPALESLLGFEAYWEETRSLFRLLLPTEPVGAGAVVAFISEEAGARGWEEFGAALVRRWTRALDGYESAADRPERAALDSLFPDRGAEGVVFDYFTGVLEDPDARLQRDPERARLVAWDLLTSLEPDRSALLSRLREAGGVSDDLAFRVVHAGASELGVVPTTSSELAWLMRLWEDEGSWGSVRGAVSSLDGPRREGLSLRHLPGVLYASRHASSLLGMSRDGLLSRAEAAIAARDRVVRGTDGLVNAQDESIAFWRSELVWGDALLIALASDAVGDGAFGSAAFALAELDRADRSTEHGGTVDFGDDGGFLLVHYAPRATERVGDHAFIAPSSMQDRSTLSLFHVHMQAQRYDNEGYAGPSGGDFEYARAHQRSCLVFTFAGRDRLNVDYYQPDGVVVDLGSVRRAR